MRMMFSSRLFNRIFFLLMGGVIALSAVFFLFTVPFVNRTILKIEEEAGRTILNNVYRMVEQYYQELEGVRNNELASHQRHARDIVLLVQSFILDVKRDIDSGKLSKAEGEQLILRRMRALTYGNNDYVWASDYNSLMLSHPDPGLQGLDFSDLRDVDGKLIVPPMVEDARSNGEGFYAYSWRRLGQKDPIKKMTYYRNVPQFGWVIGSGFYLDDMEREIAEHRETLINELRQFLRSTPIGHTGYIYIFDADCNMIIHPNPNIEKTNFRGLVNPVTGQSVGDELIAAAQRPD